jgi:opacity protein-like surface antigen
MRKFLVLLGLVLLSATCAKAQDAPTFDVAGAYEYIHLTGDNCNGFGGNAAANVNRWLGIVGDFGFCNDTSLPTGFTSHYTNYLFGPRVSFRKYGRLVPYAQFLLGGAHSTFSSSVPGQPANTSANTFAYTLGAGTDFRLTPHISIRVIQFEYLHTHFGGTKQNNMRMETGLVYHFGGKK